MGLAERRGIANFQENEFPIVKKEVETAAGFPVELEIRWDTMAEPGQADQYALLFKKIYFTPITNAFKAITVDKMGKDALKKGLKKVIIDGSNGISYSSFKFEDGVLTINHQPYCNLDAVQERTDGIRKLLEEGL